MADEYVEHLRAVFAQLARVLVPTGTAWLNLGDCYASNSNGYQVSRPGKANQPTYRPRPRLPVKNLVGMPWRVAFALQDDGWILRNAIIWNKPNAMPESVQDRALRRCGAQRAGTAAWSGLLPGWSGGASGGGCSQRAAGG